MNDAAVFSACTKSAFSGITQSFTASNTTGGWAYSDYCAGINFI